MCAVLTVGALEKELCEISERLMKTVSLRTALEHQPELTKDIALESAIIHSDDRILATYYSGDDKLKKYQTALEEMSIGIVAAIAAGIAAVVAIVVKLINHLRGNVNSSGFTGNKDQVTAVQKIVGDRELVDAVDDALRIAHDAGGTALEDFRQMGGVAVGDVFDRYKDSLNEPEVDFLTTGTRYHATKDTISEFTSRHFPSYIKGMSEDIENWVTEGLKQAPFVGKSEETVHDFMRDEGTKLAAIRRKYASHAADIEEMERRCRNHSPQGNVGHLQTFRDRPSSLFPHLEKIWKDAKFEHITEEDKKLIASLEEVKQRFEKSANVMKAKAEKRDRPWPAEEAIMRLAHDTHRDVVKHLTGLVKVGSFIRSSTHTAYRATSKSFTYILLILNAINKMPNVDHKALYKSIDVIQRKQRELNEVANIA